MDPLVKRKAEFLQEYVDLCTKHGMTISAECRCDETRKEILIIGPAASEDIQIELQDQMLDLLEQLASEERRSKLYGRKG